MSHMLENESEPLNLIFYGEGGTGKTTHLAHMADLGRVLVVNAESGLKRRALEKCGVNTANIEVFPPPGVEITYATLEKEFLRIREALHKDPNAYVGVFWDSLTEIYQILLDQARAAAYKKSLNTGSKRAQEGEFFTDRADYGDMSEQVKKLLRKFRDLPCHFGTCALERREVDDDGAVVYRPGVNPALQDKLYLWFDIVCHTTVVEENEEEQFRGQFKPVGKYRAKDRFKVLPRVLVNPTFDRVLAYVEETITVDDDPVMKAAKKKPANPTVKNEN